MMLILLIAVAAMVGGIVLVAIVLVALHIQVAPADVGVATFYGGVGVAVIAVKIVIVDGIDALFGVG